jgi:hypothetical protein
MIAGHIAISLENGFQRSKITLPPQKFAFKIGRRGVGSVRGSATRMKYLFGFGYR